MDIGTITCWDDIVGNYRIKQHLKRMIQELKVSKSPIQQQCVLILGDSRGGKTSAAQWLVRCLQCTSICPETLNPACSGTSCRCQSVNSYFGEAGIVSNLAGDSIQTSVNDCMKFATGHEIRDLAKDLAEGASPALVVLDEVGRMAKNGWDEILLSTLDIPNLHWLGTAISADGLDSAFLNRFTILNTQATSLKDLCIWTRLRMRRHAITADNDETVMKLAAAALSAPGRIINELRRVWMSDARVLTLADVEEFSAS